LSSRRNDAYRYAPTALADRGARMMLRASQFF
jgi:hypothetical protein